MIYQDTTYVIVRDGFEWDLEQPDKGLGADSLVINHLLRTLCEAPFANSIPFEELDPAAAADHRRELGSAGPQCSSDA